MEDMPRYSIINNKNPREIVLLRGTGCKWKKCSFCDYHTDFSSDTAADNKLNFQELNKVTGIYNKLEVINSGSFVDLPPETIQKILEVCKIKKIYQLHTECHWIHRKSIAEFRQILAKNNIILKVKSGIETFDFDFRENILKKGINEKNPKKIAKWFDEACFLFGLTGQTKNSMKNDIQLGLKLFERICINIMIANSTSIKPDQAVIQTFLDTIYPEIKNNGRIDILLQNSDFGVGS